MTAQRRLEELAHRYGLADDAPARFARLLDLVSASPVSLTSVRDMDEAVEVHVADSLTGLLVPDLEKPQRIADLGSGAGFPGLVLAIARPAAQVMLVESAGRKATFLRKAIDDLGLPNAAVAACRAEEWDAGRDAHDVVTARALAPLTTLVEYAAPLLAVGGALVAWKGPAGWAELADGQAAAARLGLTTPEATDVSPTPGDDGRKARLLYVSHKVSLTPSGYPRRPGMARKRPILASSSA